MHILQVKRKMLGNSDEKDIKIDQLEANFNSNPILKLASKDSSNSALEAIRVRRRLREFRLNRVARWRAMLNVEDRFMDDDKVDTIIDKDLCKLLKYMKQTLSDIFSSRKHLTVSEVALLETRLNLIPRIFKLIEGCQRKVKESKFLQIFEHVAEFVQWLFEIQGGICDQHVADIETEIDRLSSFVALSKFQYDIKKVAVVLTQKEKDTLDSLHSLMKSGKFVKKDEIPMIRSVSIKCFYTIIANGGLRCLSFTKQIKLLQFSKF